MFSNLFAKSYWKTNLRLLLVLPFVCQILLGLGVVGYLSYRNGQRALEEITSRLRKEIGIRIDNHVDDFVYNGDKLNQINENYLQLNPSDSIDLTKLGAYFITEFSWNEQVNMIAFVNNQGDYIEVQKSKSGDLELTIIDKNKSNALLTYLVNSQGTIVELIKTETNYKFDPLKESWYLNAIQSKDGYWHQVERKKENEQGRKLAFINSKKVYDRDGKLIGVLTNQSNLINLSSFSVNYKLGKQEKLLLLIKKEF